VSAKKRAPRNSGGGHEKHKENAELGWFIPGGSCSELRPEDLPNTHLPSTGTDLSPSGTNPASAGANVSAGFTIDIPCTSTDAVSPGKATVCSAGHDCLDAATTAPNLATAPGRRPFSRRSAEARESASSRPERTTEATAETTEGAGSSTKGTPEATKEATAEATEEQSKSREAGQEFQAIGVTGSSQSTQQHGVQELEGNSSGQRIPSPNSTTQLRPVKHEWNQPQAAAGW
jgi:hypothetical protein